MPGGLPRIGANERGPRRGRPLRSTLSGDKLMELPGQMMYAPMLLSSILEQAARHSAEVEIVSRRVEGDIHRYTYRDCHARSMQLAQALGSHGIEPGDRIGTLA